MKTLIVVFSWRDSELTDSCINWWKPHLNKQTELLVVYSDVKQEEKKKEGFITHWRIKDHPGMGMLSLMVYNSYVDKFDFFVRNDNDFRLSDINSFWPALTRFQSVSEWAALTGKLYYPDGKINYAQVKYNFFGGSPYFSYPLKTSITDTFLGAFVVVKTSSLKKLGRWFDPSIILFGEELEFSLAIKNIDQLIVYDPSVEGTHHCNGSINSSKFFYTKLQFTNQYTIFKKYLGLKELCFFFFNAFKTLLYRHRLKGLKLVLSIFIGRKIKLNEWQKFLLEEN